MCTFCSLYKHKVVQAKFDELKYLHSTANICRERFRLSCGEYKFGAFVDY